MSNPVEISTSQVEGLARLHCTYEEVASFLRCSDRTIKRLMKKPEYREAWNRGLADGKLSLRRQQFKLAMLENSAGVHMAIHLGKFVLDQKETSSVEVTGKDGAPLVRAEPVVLIIPSNGREIS